MTELKAKFNFKQYVRILPLEGLKGRITSIIFDGTDVMYNVEYYSDCSQNKCYFYEDELVDA